MAYVGYVRVSKVGKRSGESFRSPRDQRAAIERYAEFRGVDVEFLPDETDKSGGTDRRPILQQAVEGVESGVWEGIIVWEYSRFFRNSELDARYTKRIQAAGGEVLSTTEDFPFTAFGTFMRTINAANHQLYRDQKSEQFRALQTSLVEAGRWRPPVVPPGYVKGDDGRLVVAPSAKTVRRVFKMRSEGKSIYSIIRATKLTRRVVSRMLENRVYLGEIRLGDDVREGCHQAIVTPRLFEQVQSMKGVTHPKKRGSLLAGLVRCEACGYVMGHSVTPRPNYSCKPYGHKFSCPSSASIASPALDQYVEGIARRALAELDVRAKTQGVDIEALESELAAAELELSTYVSAVSAVDVGEIAFRRGAKERRARVESAKQAIGRATVASPLATGSALESWERWNTHQKNSALRGLIDCIVVRKGVRGRPVQPAERVRVFARHTIDFSERPLPFPDRHNEVDPRILG